MKKNIIQNIMFLIALIVYLIFFWHLPLGLYTLLFSTMILGVLHYINREAFQSYTARLLGLSVLMTAFGLLFSQSNFNKIIYLGSLTATIGFVQRRTLRFLWYIIFALSTVLFTPIKRA